MPLIASIPHAGTWLPPGYGARLASEVMRALPMTDWHMDALFDFLPALGVSVIAAEASRFVIDLNRPPAGEKLYPGRYETGLVALRSFDDEAIFAEPPAADEIAWACREIYEPYHRELDALLARRRLDGKVILLDLHSVTPEANRISGPLDADIFLGDRDGKSCASWLTDAVAASYEKAGFRLRRNDPYKGGWITERGGRLAGVEALQIEMNWAVYLDPARPAEGLHSQRFDAARENLQTLFTELAPLLSARLRQSTDAPATARGDSPRPDLRGSDMR
ncbi:MAG TPA: N-formylglutamate amidohydrolase [Gammaproteobacteria bacterium]|nr:N-formylglutamate amidohydrolase [Gammaproteobacteria bacterium]